MEAYNRCLQSETRYLGSFVLQKRDGGEGDFKIFIEQYPAGVADIEKSFERLETPLDILENKVRLDLKLMQLKFIDNSEKALMEGFLKSIGEFRIKLREDKTETLALKHIDDDAESETTSS